ncbi:CAMK/CAMKL/KIN1 protein kinase [Nematocida parisii ERTm1]|uniref:CAMK/CAMKL/KIN1 protein kinase n=1 Tax=Nematocida parisii (strain ERTm3) TaxID=935791 RepID=I3EIB7_NEMP3|nr:CAMK/CAMKL/KIN1 protein kinase [Nematocida parisii ERTm1]EIJ88964.1 CAMK/CAMKL/KIN1 protein kinase [Nematocida parisii ERTm3]EIJ93481.1 CAMK/CAMKL/KIN1 protein kinase [Nematocida parisii ERTm1]|eukprot:XP_013059651.1 CAMK/CAMKL/KIN1 protein kinase [Nematocida parisii ERTm1]
MSYTYFIYILFITYCTIITMYYLLHYYHYVSSYPVGDKGKRINTIKISKSMHEKKHERMNNYILKEVIETGTTSYVYKGIDIRNNETVAIKIISRINYIGIEKKQSRENRVLREVLISYILSHKHILKLKEFFYTKECFYLIFNYISGEQLLKKIVKNKKLSEITAKKYFIQILDAIQYCHNHNIVHRDIKIENILINKDDNAILIDFGLSNFFENEGFLGTFCGSLYFAAPELLSGNLYKGPEVDIWSLGVVLYVMVCGKVPFDDKNLQLLYHKITNSNILTDGVSEELKSLLLQMLNPDRNTRISVQQILNHPWVNDNPDITQSDITRYNPNLEVLDNSICTYINHLFNNQFIKKDGLYCNSIHKVYSLIKYKYKGNIYTDRVDSIVDFICDKKVKIRNSYIKHMKGIRAGVDVLIIRLEEIIKEMGIVYEVTSGEYFCVNDGVIFKIEIYKNILSKAYGITIKGKNTKKGNNENNKYLKKIKETVRYKLKESLNPDKLCMINNL